LREESKNYTIFKSLQEGAHHERGDDRRGDRTWFGIRNFTTCLEGKVFKTYFAYQFNVKVYSRQKAVPIHN
jgi:hypothetical protein